MAPHARSGLWSGLRGLPEIPAVEDDAAAHHRAQDPGRRDVGRRHGRDVPIEDDEVRELSHLQRTDLPIVVELVGPRSR